MDIAIKNVISAVVYLANKQLAGTPTEYSAALLFSRKMLRHNIPEGDKHE
nr:hypothetical protein [Bacteroidota bacterium]